jgi:hypothetical protein
MLETKYPKGFICESARVQYNIYIFLHVPGYMSAFIRLVEI